MSSPIALVTGITGQDGSYLAELLLTKGYEVHGTVRRTSTIARSRLKHLYADPEIYNRALFLHYADLNDPTTLRRVLTKVAPDEFYHLAGQGGTENRTAQFIYYGKGNFIVRYPQTNGIFFTLQNLWHHLTCW